MGPGTSLVLMIAKLLSSNACPKTMQIAAYEYTYDIKLGRV